MTSRDQLFCWKLFRVFNTCMLKELYAFAAFENSAEDIE